MEKERGITITNVDDKKQCDIHGVIVPFVCRDCGNPTKEYRDGLCETCHKWHTDS